MKLDRASVMRDAHRRYRNGKRLGLGWDANTYWPPSALEILAKAKDGRR